MEPHDLTTGRRSWVGAEIAWGPLQFHWQINHVQQGVGCGEGHQPKPAASGKSLKKPDRPDLDMEDEIKINLELNVNNKTLGAATGPPLSDNNIEA